MTRGTQIAVTAAIVTVAAGTGIGVGMYLKGRSLTEKQKELQVEIDKAKKQVDDLGKQTTIVVERATKAEATVAELQRDLSNGEVEKNQLRTTAAKFEGELNVEKAKVQAMTQYADHNKEIKKDLDKVLSELDKINQAMAKKTA